ncbi:hypothetical protein [Pontiella agarivorans]|uniref:Uncharacterized protein n=1 Tax=Pontiella agarivorans TaxID=3038953 RepID=A0ABU5MSX7_9BACT|nr:hypothetical protein [Pontiella agarivorans]MDZ8117243.1 hypothetical protein [Pontiella agarivorans]
MEIGFTTSSTTTVGYHTNLPKPTHAPSSGNECDRARTSDKALLLSRSLATLKEQMLPREEILQRFSSDRDAPVELDAASLDRIIDQL